MVEHAILVFGDGRDVWMLDQRNRLSQFSHFPDIACDDIAVCVTDHGVLVTGGWNPNSYSRSNKVHLFVPSTREWRHLQNMMAARSDHASVHYAGVAYVIGGDVSGAWSSNVEILDLNNTDAESAQWQSAPRIPTAHNHDASDHCVLGYDKKQMQHAAQKSNVLRHPYASVLNGLIYVMGDFNTRLFAFDPQTTQHDWESKAELPISPGCGLSMAAGREHLYVAGGNQKLCAMYSPTDDVWTVIQHKPVKQHVYGAMVVRGESLVIMGGGCADVQQFDTEEKTWCTLDVKLPKSLTYHQAVIMEV